MTKKILIILLIAIGLLAVASGGYYWWWQSQPENMIVVKDTPEGEIVENRKEGVSMKVPEGWEVQKHPGGDAALEIQKFGPKQTIDTELQDGMIIELYIQSNPLQLDIREFAAQNWNYTEGELKFSKLGGKDVVKTIDKMSYGTDENDESIYLEESKIIDVSFVKDKKVYIFSCSSIGQDYKMYSVECEKIIKNKILNEF